MFGALIILAVTALAAITLAATWPYPAKILIGWSVTCLGVTFEFLNAPERRLG
jgi:uncharacterized membrane protein